MMGLFGKRPDPKTQVREWSSKLRSEQNKIERQINQIKREEEKVSASLKQAAKKGDKESCRILAKEVVRARKSVTKMYSSKVRTPYRVNVAFFGKLVVLFGVYSALL